MTTVETQENGAAQEAPSGPQVQMFEESFVVLLANHIGELTANNILRNQALARSEERYTAALQGIEVTQASFRARTQDYENLRRLYAEVQTERDDLKNRLAELEAAALKRAKRKRAVKAE